MAKTKTDTTKNLKPCKTTQEAKKRGSKGGKRSAEVRKQKKTLKEIANMLLDMTAPEEVQERIKELCPNLNPKEMTNRLAIVQRLIINALAGDNKSFELLRDQIGEKPTEKVEQTNTNIEVNDPKLINSVIEKLKEL